MILLRDRTDVIKGVFFGVVVVVIITIVLCFSDQFLCKIDFKYWDSPFKL